jgi:hypothetical protein
LLGLLRQRTGNHTVVDTAKKLKKQRRLGLKTLGPLLHFERPVLAAMLFSVSLLCAVLRWLLPFFG